MRDAQVRRQTRLIHGEAVILTADHHASAVDIEHRMVRTVMAKFHFYRACAGCKTQELMAETNTEHRNARCDQPFDGFDRIIARLGISRAIGQKHTVWT